MNRSCDNCYWEDTRFWFCSFVEDRPIENVCNEHKFGCNTCGSDGKYKYEGKYYCSDCLLGQFDIEKFKTTHYMFNGEYLGSDEDIGEVILALDDSIMELD